MSRHVSESEQRRTDRFRPERGGWRLDVARYHRPGALDPGRRPVVMIPGYAMNAFILGFHPTRRSMIAYLVDEGFEVWTANLRGQGDSRRTTGDSEYGFRDLATVDLPNVADLVLRETRTDSERFDIIGCSLGASFVYAYLAHHLADHSIGSVVAIGGPLRWVKVHPAVRLVFASPSLADFIPSSGTRLMARLAIPIVKRLPALGSLYMNVHQIDLDRAEDLVKTVDDPNPKLNREISRWIRQRDLIVGGVDVARELADVETPILCVLANRDGIVPPESALSIRDAIGTDEVSILRVGDDENWFAHADLFISEYAEQKVFEPLADWLVEN